MTKAVDLNEGMGDDNSIWDDATKHNVIRPETS